jgi:glutamate synthase (ferredoxin)
VPKWTSTQIRKQEVHSNGPVLDDVLLNDPEVRILHLFFTSSGVLDLVNVCSQWLMNPVDAQIADAIENEKIVEKKLKIFNVDRSVGGRVSGAIAKKYGDTGFAGEIKLAYAFLLLSPARLSCHNSSRILDL